MKNFSGLTIVFLAILGVATVSPTETRFDRVESGFYTPLSVAHGRTPASEDSVFSFDLAGQSFINMRPARVLLVPDEEPTRIIVYRGERGRRSFWVVASASVPWADELTGVEVNRAVVTR
ncbi:MAG: hypothetical protein Q8P33_03690 [bacterium]|nr:hypothetical protein [bacterium]